MSRSVARRVLPWPLEINSDRLLRRIRELGLIGRNSATGGITRTGFSATDREGRDYLINEARVAGLVSRVDAAGNILIGMADGQGQRPTLVMGSHIDTVVNGGRLDGAYGVLAALEVLQVCAESDFHGSCELMAVAFANEEGALFPQPFFGSMVVSGRLADLPAEPQDHHGHSLREPLKQVGGDLATLDGAVWPAGSVAAYLELHIEQGPVLEHGGHQIGVVDAITGRCILTVEIHGTAAHAGTTPMDARHDAVTAACRVVLAVESLSRDRQVCRVSTVGRIDVHPNSPNTIAGVVRLTADLRDTDSKRLSEAETAIRDTMASLAEQTGTEITVVSRVRSAPVSTSAELRTSIRQSAAELGFDHITLPSGAGHDAQMVAGVAPIAMIFVPSRAGVSHCPEEETDADHLMAGAQVLLRTAIHIAELHETR
ncbi:M20 family metallo-hydrolase [Actinocrispum wychmicini]|uniref:N-carbamoyl-L-amino-acid hydrolase n=1 Tax=Actinocrispum wychmicini TaxID=1213861 RepID=A0A4R2J6F8_9PSEU|nr:M20 family metallo-hydrolase [Actinocrispum wychmicini]TCO54024.1 N-carbamoyl-L-amino-acid hydrolase [Actinocrispum wychmicini]